MKNASTHRTLKPLHLILLVFSLTFYSAGFAQTAKNTITGYVTYEKQLDRSDWYFIQQDGAKNIVPSKAFKQFNAKPQKLKDNKLKLEVEFSKDQKDSVYISKIISLN